ncbi:MAG: DUF6266 family protein [Bacteroidota bacterium]|nr:DUF6266 family protein [Bacteroidota bacterium]
MMSNNNQGMLTGLVGSVVFVKGKNGEAIVRSKPVYKKKKLTPKRQESCNRFSTGGAFIKPIYPFLKSSFTDFLEMKTARDAIRSYTLKNAVKLEQGKPVIDYPKFLISTGKRRAYHAVQQQRVETELFLEWQPDSTQAFAQSDDLLSVVGYTQQTSEYLFFEACATRAAAQVHLELPEALADAPVHLWATFSTFSGDSYAYSTYLGLL